MNQPAACTLSRTAESLHFTGSALNYRITGLTPYNLDRLLVTLKTAAVDAPATFHIDTVDLYNNRSRESFAESCTKYLKTKQSAVMAELSQLIAALEEERINMRERGTLRNLYLLNAKKSKK